MQIAASSSNPVAVDADLLVAGVFKGGIEGPGVAAVLDAMGLDDPPTTPTFRGEIGQHLRMATPDLPCDSVLFVGLGRMDEIDHERLRRASGVAGRACRGAGRVTTTLAMIHPTSASIGAVAEGFELGVHAARGHGAHDAEMSLEILCPSRYLDEAGAAITRAAVYCRATATARELTDLPPADKRPEALANRIVALVGDCCEAQIIAGDDLAVQGFGAISAVGRGSAHPPQLLILRHLPTNPLGHVALVGKGITFDAGGLSLKTAAGMTTMKSDMAGAAHVAAACAALRDLDVRVEVTAVLPLAENVPDGDAMRPGDVLTAFDGTTIEVSDTDAEGRLVLADALAYAASREPDAIVDLATLTGSMVSGLSVYAAGALGNDADLAADLAAAADVSGEQIWSMPIWDDLRPFLSSSVADVRNIADSPAVNPYGDGIFAALFLQRFVGDIPWRHLDIAGPAFLDAALASDYRGPGATGFGVRTLLAWLERRT